MMDFSTRYLKNSQFKFAKMLLRCFVAFVFFVISATLAVHAASADGAAPASIGSLQVERSDGAVFLNAQVAFDFGLGRVRNVRRFGRGQRRDARAPL